MKISISFRSIILRISLAMIFVCPIWLRILYSIGVHIIGGVSNLTKQMMLCLDIVLLILNFFEYLKGKKLQYGRFFFYIIILCVLIIFCILFDNGYNGQIFTNFMGRVAPFLLLYVYIEDDKQFYELYRSVSYIVCIGVLIFPFTKAYTMSTLPAEWQWNYMSFGYNTIVCWACVLFSAYRYRRKLDFVISYILVFIYAIYSTRVMILCLAVTISVAIMFYDRYTKRIRYIFLTLGFGGILALFGNSIAMSIVLFLEKKGITSRTLTLIVQGKMRNSKGRDIIYAKLMPYLKDEFLYPHGLGFDRKVCGIYSHNMFVELMLSFGLIVFILICMIYIYEISAILKSEKGDLICVCLSICVPQFVYLQMSSTVCTELFLYIVLFTYEKIKYRKLKSINDM